jgi:glycine betaine/proline transport system substrate-binding protein
LRRYQGKLVDLGTIYEDCSLGWVVPDYIPTSEVRTIADLGKPEVKALFHGAIQGIGATAGIMALSRKAMAEYGLDYKLLESSGPAMAKRLGEAVDNKAPIVVTGWRPHWKFAQYPLRYLEDPKGVFKSRESVHVVARLGFEEDYPAAAAFLRRMHFRLDELEALMVQARKTSHSQAILEWIGKNKAKVQFWMHGK